MDIRKLYINGEWTDSVSGEYIEIENPDTKEIFAKVPRGNADDVDKAVKAACAAFETWQYTPLEERVNLMKKVLAGLKSRREELIHTITRELGSPVKVSAEVHTDPFLLETEHYIKVASEFSYEVRRQTSVVRREPVGVVGGLTPWNFPLEQIEKKVVPALLAGNCVVLKPSQYTPMTAYILAEEIDKAGYPAGVFNLVTGRGGEVGDALAVHPDVDMISFTGSTAAGREVARKALVNIKKIALELGGKSAAILLKGGDWEQGIRSVLDTVMLNGGQTCNALTRLLVPEDELEKAEEILVRQTAGYKFGPVEDPETDMGPLASRKQFDRVKGYIELGIQEGARVLLGKVPEDDGSYKVEPVIFSDVKRDMRIAQEEIFGPVLVVLPYKDVEEAVSIANDSIYGLAGGVFGPEKEANEVARQMKTGTVYVNAGQWDVASPFGGYRQSGLGREGGVEGYEEFLEVKTIYDK
ncbi:MAG TPA: aldehyde dehydrogenase family protein [Candidatus Bariatricus faecipullorum]|nr:aldehyde dehydrogenase family protein [Candidatus Bariatricus faecipullorum]